MENLKKKELSVIFLTSLWMLSIVLSGQTSSVSLGLKIPDTVQVLKHVKVNDCITNAPKGSVIKVEEQKKFKDQTITITQFDTLSTQKSIRYSKTIKVPLISMPGDADLYYEDDKKKENLLINYWLNPTHIVPSGTDIKIITRRLQCPTEGNPKYTYVNTENLRKLQSDEEFLLWKVELKEDYNFNDLKKESWFIHADKIIEVLSTTGAVDYYLVNRYDRDGKYELKVKNRTTFKYSSNRLEYGPITIPIKYRLGYETRIEGNDIEVDDEFSADLNLGAFLGLNLGSYKARFEGKTFRQLPSVSGTIGIFSGLSTASLDSLSTTAGANPFSKDEKATIGVFSPGMGIMLNVYNINFGLFTGLDFGFGSNAKNWNYNNRLWLGFGIMYNVNAFWSKK